MKNLKEVDIDLETTLCIVSAMKKMANIDGEEHEEELEFINAFVAELKEEFGSFESLPESSDISLLNSPEKQLLFLQCVTYVALADKEIQDAELVLLNEYIDQLSLEISAEELIRSIGLVVLERYSGIKIFKEEAIALGATFGLDRDAVLSVIQE